MKEGWGPDCGPYIDFYRDDEMGWRDRKEWTPLYTTPPAAQRKPLTLGQKQRLWSSVGDKPTLKDRVNAYGLAIEAAHGITEKGNT
jgi:hypothetical protein